MAVKKGTAAKLFAKAKEGALGPMTSSNIGAKVAQAKSNPGMRATIIRRFLLLANFAKDPGVKARARAAIKAIQRGGKKEA